MNKKDYRPAPFISDDFGIDFTVEAWDDMKMQCVMIKDKFGFFLPVSFTYWNAMVNLTYHPALMKRKDGVSPQLAYEKAILMFCRDFQHTYICMN